MSDTQEQDNDTAETGPAPVTEVDARGAEEVNIGQPAQESSGRESGSDN